MCSGTKLPATFTVESIEQSSSRSADVILLVEK